MLDALEAMAEDTQPIPPRAMILSRKYRSLVSSWIEPMQDEADIGKEIDYIARWVFPCQQIDLYVFYLFLKTYNHTLEV